MMRRFGGELCWPISSCSEPASAWPTVGLEKMGHTWQGSEVAEGVTNQMAAANIELV